MNDNLVELKEEEENKTKNTVLRHESVIVVINTDEWIVVGEEGGEGGSGVGAGKKENKVKQMTSWMSLSLSCETTVSYLDRLRTRVRYVPEQSPEAADNLVEGRRDVNQRVSVTGNDFRS